MTSKQRTRVREIAAETLGQNPAERDRFVAEACQNDSELMGAVWRLLEQQQSATELGSPLITSDVELSGQTLGHYRIGERVGSGGMGVVYKAQDTKLDRTVALKFLRRDAVCSEELRARFLHEARAAAALDHPNICTIHEIDETKGHTFLAMVYVEGESLADKIKERPLPVAEALDIAVQVAEGLRAAHRKGVIHRDVKSANIMVDDEGRVKIMDFGLAYLGGQTRLTEAGATVGTPAYMSPEQLRGGALDHRADIWSFGVVVYNMLTGQLPFKGEVREAVAHSILYEAPEPLTGLRSGVPLELERIINKLLVKDPGERYQQFDDLLVDLRTLKKAIELESTPGTGFQQPLPAPAPARGRRWPWVVAVVAIALAASAVSWIAATGSRNPSGEMRVVPLTSYPGVEMHPSFSPDGSLVAFVTDQEGNNDIYIKQIGTEQPRPLVTSPAPEYSPVWSPDGLRIAFLRLNASGKLAYVLVPAIGGAERKFAEGYLFQHESLRGPFASWSPDSKWLVAVFKPSAEEPPSLFAISSETGETRRITSSPAGIPGDGGVALSPDGRRLLFSRSTGGRKADLYLVDLAADLTPRGEPRQVTFDGAWNTHPAWSADGSSILFTSGSDYDTSTLRRLPASGAGTKEQLHFAGSGVGLLAVARQSERLAFERWTLDWNISRVDLGGGSGRPSMSPNVVASTRMDLGPAWSPDGTKIAFVSSRTGEREIWMSDNNGNNAVQVTFHESFVAGPDWSPDGSQIVFDSDVGGNRDLYIVAIDGGAPRPLTTDTAADHDACWSADGQWIYFTSDRTGRREIWKIPAGGGDAVQVTHNRGSVPAESRDGKDIYYLQYSDLALGSSLWRVPADGGEETEVFSGVFRANFAVAEEGIYYIGVPERAGRYPLKLRSFANGAVKQVAELETEPGWVLSASRNGRSLLYSGADDLGRDLMLVESFR